MARPVKHTVDYFPHDATASSGKTLTILEDRYKNDGYAFWFKLLETLANSPDHYYDCSNSLNWEFLQAKTHMDAQTATQILDLLVALEAIDKALWQEKRVIWCDNLVQRLSDVYVNRRTSLPTKPSYDGEKPLPTTVTNPSNTPDDIVTTPTNTESKVKETKVNNISTKVESTTSVDNEKNLKELTDIGKKAKKEPPEWVTWKSQVFAGLAKRRQYSMPAGKRAGEAKQMSWLFKQGYKPDDILRVYDKLKLGYWADKPLTLMSLAGQIGEVINAEKQAKATSSVRYVNQ